MSTTAAFPRAALALNRAGRLATPWVLAACAVWGAGTAQASVVFSQDFESPLSGWTAGSTTKPYDAVVSSAYVYQGQGALHTFIGPGNDGDNFGGESVWASIDISLATAGDYVLSLWTASNQCNGCSFDVQFDSVSIASGDLDATWLSVSQALSGLGVGTHTLQVGVTLGKGATGVNGAFFDNITLTAATPPVDVPEPTSLLLAGAALGLLAAQRRRS